MWGLPVLLAARETFNPVKVVCKSTYVDGEYSEFLVPLPPTGLVAGPAQLPITASNPHFPYGRSVEPD